MVETTARIKKNGKHFEILVDLEEALKFKKNPKVGNLSASVLTDAVFYNLKSGEHASREDLEENFGTSDFMIVAEKIVCTGEVVRTADYINEEQEKKYKQIVDFLSKNAVSPEGRPYTPDRFMKALHEVHINVKNVSIESQIGEIIDALAKILPLKIDKKKVKLRIPARYTGKVYGTVKEFMVEESWQGNGDLETVVEVPSGLIMDFYDKINDFTHGSVLSEEVK